MNCRRFILKMKIEALTIRISCLADDVGPVSSLKKKQGEFECPVLTCPVISCHAFPPRICTFVLASQIVTSCRSCKGCTQTT